MIVNLKEAWKIVEDIITMHIDLYRGLECKFCGSGNVVRYGHYHGFQRYFCKDCGRKFADNEAPPHMKTPAKQISAALNMYYSGMSLNAIRRHLEQQYQNCPSDSTVYEWIVRFTREAISHTRNLKPSVGDTWLADETMLNIEGENTWVWDIIDSKTRFLLASHMSQNRTTKDAKALMEKAAEKAGKTPRVVITDKLQAYLDGIELAFGADTKHVQSKPFKVGVNTNLIERFQGTLKDRTKIMRGLKKRETAELFMDGWLIHYNFFRPHESLAGKTPAEKAGIVSNFKDWGYVIREGKPEPMRMQLVNHELIVMNPHQGYIPSIRERSKIIRRKPMSGLSEIRIGKRN